jgi:hypothetical protein
LWLVNSAGQLESSVPLPQAPEAPPCPLANEVLVPLAGRIHVARAAGRSAVQDFMLPTGEVPKWVSLSALPDQRVAAVTSAGSIIQLRINEAPRAHRGEVARLELGEAVHLSAVSEGDFFAVADVSHRVSLFNGNLEPQGKRIFEQGVSGPPRLAGGKVFVEVSGGKFLCLNPDERLSPAWELTLPETSVAGILHQNDRFYVALRNGAVLTVDAKSGEVLNRIATGNMISMGPLAAGGSLFVATPDGSIIRLPEGEQKAASP